jgi:hypothetical protein
MVVGLLSGTLVSEILVILCIFLVLYIIFKLGKLIAGLIVNVILGFVSIFALNAIFGLGLTFSLVVLVITAIFGLPGVAVIVVLKLLGITL